MRADPFSPARRLPIRSFDFEARPTAMPTRTFVARQPILDRKGGVFAYELLFRDGLESFYRCESHDRAASSVIADSLLVIGVERLTAGRHAFVNVTREVLLQDHVTLLPPDLTVIELLESVKPDAEVMEACERLRELGYRIALDDYVPDPALDPLLEVVDLVKVDFLETRGDERHRVADRLRPYGVELVAEKVETAADRDDGVRAGFHYFQGYFFARPETVVARDVPGFAACVDLLRAVAKEPVDFDELAVLVGRNPALCYKLLRAANSALYGFCDTVRSIPHALALLGVREMRRWISLLTMATLGAHKPTIVVATTLERARFCELLAPTFGLAARSDELFLLGLFSMMDAVLDRPLEDVVSQVALGADIRAALLERSGPLAAPYEAALAYERANWEELTNLCDEPEREDAVAHAWQEALYWSGDALSLTASAS